MDKVTGKLVLSLEAGLNAGSVSIIREGKQIDFSMGAGNLSRSEDLLAMTEEILLRNGINKRNIGLIAVSEETGSLTGLRIGVATAKGLGDSLSVRVCRISILEALAVLSNREGRLFCALFTKPNEIYFREYLSKDGQYLAIGNIFNKADIKEFASILESSEKENLTFVFNEELFTHPAYSFEQSDNPSQSKFCLIKGNPAEILGLAAESCV